MSDALERKKSPRKNKNVRIASILKAARETFEQQGYEQAKISEIAEKVDIVEGTIFHYFGSKRKLVLKVMEDFYNGITESLYEEITGIQGTRNRLHFVIWHHLKVISDNAPLCAVILRESRGLDKAFSKDIYQLNRNYTAPLRQVIQEGVANGEINPEISISMVSNTVYGSIEHALWNLLSDGETLDVAKTAKDFTDMVFNGIRVHTTEVESSEAARLIKKLNKLL
ncbi:TetR/AcrR family transcriptional regulator [Oceanicoccus sp. KOV_DT_Chl]|uniref:TetR/AcrR family transcriptional regulator n=1 Tax=Oceanicoccus sp. KOV_DT_Chl TaxID=1904639 RepID=UPI000C7AC308|nr:TetR/AcrR family transcriptional regulator [Oceanicoccus sp. KOV_DT_Chl]